MSYNLKTHLEEVSFLYFALAPYGRYTDVGNTNSSLPWASKEMNM